MAQNTQGHNELAETNIPCLLPWKTIDEINNLTGSIEISLEATKFVQVFDFLSVFGGNEGTLNVVANAAGLNGLPPVDIANATYPVDL